MNANHQHSISFHQITRKIGSSRGMVFGLLIIGALLAFEIFNYSTTEYALNDLLGGLRFSGIRWATILAIAFCGIDFAGIARLFTPQQTSKETREVWYLLGAWLLAASMNAMLTWWGVSLAIVNHESLGATVIERDTLMKIVPIFVALMVWLIRVLIIGTFSVAGDRLYSQASTSIQAHPSPINHTTGVTVRNHQTQPAAFHPIPKASSQVDRRSSNPPEPTYHPAGMSGYKTGGTQHNQ